MREVSVLSSLAQYDREEIFRYIADDDVEAAQRVDRELDKVLVRLAKNPHIGHTRRDLLPASGGQSTAYDHPHRDRRRDCRT